MDKQVYAWLYDIRKAIEEIDLFLEGKPKDFLKYKEDILLKRAIERELEIIGEAMNRILKVDPEMENGITDARNIIGLRNQVIHAYDNISDETIWSVIINHIPKLKEEIDLFLKE